MVNYGLIGNHDISAFLTKVGKKLLEKMGVETGRNVSVGKTTIQNLFNLYNVAQKHQILIDPPAI